MQDDSRPSRRAGGVETSTVRGYVRSDRNAVYDICVRTGASGGDARGRFRSDLLLPDVYAGPYLDLEPDLAFVLDTGSGVAGYIVGAQDTASFVRAYRQRWLPLVEGRYRSPAHPPVTPEDDLLRRLRSPERMLVPQLAPHPAHLHVNLLPEYQGAGYGRALVEILMTALAARGVPSVHLGVAEENLRARAFYVRLGFEPVDGDEAGTHLWRSTTARQPVEA